jgi:hypothetical protein
VANYKNVQKQKVIEYKKSNPEATTRFLGEMFKVRQATVVGWLNQTVSSQTVSDIQNASDLQNVSYQNVSDVQDVTDFQNVSDIHCVTVTREWVESNSCENILSFKLHADARLKKLIYEYNELYESEKRESDRDKLEKEIKRTCDILFSDNESYYLSTINKTGKQLETDEMSCIRYYHEYVNRDKKQT